MQELIESIEIQAPIDRCFNLTRSIEMHQDSSTLIAGRAVGGKQKGLSMLGDETVWSARFFGLRFRLCTRILEMNAPLGFREEMIRGLMQSFGHVYTLEAMTPESTRLTDRFWFALPFGPIGRLIERLILKRKMMQVQQHRLQAIQRACESEVWKQYLDTNAPTTEANKD